MSVSGVQAEKITVVLCGYRILTDFISGFLQCRNDHNVYEILRPQSDELLIRSYDEANDAVRVRIQPSTNTRMPPGISQTCSWSVGVALCRPTLLQTTSGVDMS